jgi:hypothetical protein
MLSRRDLVGKLAAGAAGVVVLGAASKGAKAALRPEATSGQTGRGDGLIAEAGPQVEPGPVEVQETGSMASAVIEEAPAAPAPVAPWGLLAPLALGATVSHDWRITDLSAPTDGASVLTLQNDRGRVQRVHLCRNDGTPQGLVYSEQVDLVVMNGGQGDLGTEEHLAQAVATVAHVIAANERAWKNTEALGALLPHAERLRQFSAATECGWALR